MTDKRKILFVDDEPNVLQGLKRTMRSMRGEWDMTFAGSAREALDIMNGEFFNVIITDMRMPGMDGAELLRQVAELYPGTIRIILSGHSDQELILKSVNVAHQFLSKPTEADEVRSTINRACNLRNIISGNEMAGIISKVNTLPSIPAIYTEIMNELQSPSSSIKSVAHIIEKDAGMSAKILQVVNSAFFGIRRKLSSPQQAVSLLGLDVIRSLVLSVHVFSQFDPSKSRKLSLNKVWQHSSHVGTFAKQIIENEMPDSQVSADALISGLLHDIGKLVLLTNFTEKYEQIISHSMELEVPLVQVEKDTFGVDHGAVGAYLLGLWGLPDRVVEAIAFHHDPAHSQTTTVCPLWAVYAANIFEHEMYPRRTLTPTAEFDEEYFRNRGYKDRVPVWREICQQQIIEESD